MRILFFIGMLNLGGAQRQIAQLSDGLAQRGHDISVVTLFPGGPSWEWLQSRNSVKLHSLFTKKLKGSIPVGLQFGLAAPRLRSLLRKERVQVVHSALYLSNLIAWLAVCGIPSVKLVWGIRASNLELNWKRALPFHLCKRVSASVPLLIANSTAGLDYHKAQGYRSQRSVVIPNGIDVEQFCPNLEARKHVRAEWRITEDEKLIGLVARLDSMKDHPTFLKAAALLAQERGDVRFVCVGDGPTAYRQKLHTLSKELGLTGRLIWAGTREDMPAVYNALDIVCSSSYSEGFPNVVGEAMACGVPCVVTDVGDSAWIVEKTGIVVRPGIHLELTNGLERILSEGSKFSGEIARQRIIENFSLKTAIEKSIEVLEQV